MGLLRFVPHERLDAEVGESWAGSRTSTPRAEPDAWHPLDLLIAPLYDEKGELRGTLAIDLPEDGKRPGPARRQLLQRYAEQAGRAVITALEREALSAPGAAGRGSPRRGAPGERRSCAWTASSATPARR